MSNLLHNFDRADLNSNELAESSLPKPDRHTTTENPLLVC